MFAGMDVKSDELIAELRKAVLIKKTGYFLSYLSIHGAFVLH